MRQSKHERAIRAELEEVDAHIRTSEGEQIRVGNKLRELKGQKAMLERILESSGREPEETAE